MEDWWVDGGVKLKTSGVELIEDEELDVVEEVNNDATDEVEACKDVE